EKTARAITTADAGSNLIVIKRHRAERTCMESPEVGRAWRLIRHAGTQHDRFVRIIVRRAAEVDELSIPDKAHLEPALHASLPEKLRAEKDPEVVVVDDVL